jgi:hypothetical protein
MNKDELLEWANEELNVKGQIDWQLFTNKGRESGIEEKEIKIMQNKISSDLHKSYFGKELSESLEPAEQTDEPEQSGLGNVVQIMKDVKMKEPLKKFKFKVSMKSAQFSPFTLWNALQEAVDILSKDLEYLPENIKTERTQEIEQLKQKMSESEAGMLGWASEEVK